MRLRLWLVCLALVYSSFCQLDLAAQAETNSGVLLIPEDVYDQIPTRAVSRATLAPTTEPAEAASQAGGLSDVAPLPDVPPGDGPLLMLPQADAMYSAAPGIDQNWGPDDSIELPDQVDLRDYLPTPGKQSQNDCVAWAVAYSTYSCQIGQERRRKPTFASDQFSPKYVYDNLSSNGGGLTILQAVNFLKLNGCASRANLDTPSGPISSNAVVEANTFKLLDNARARNINDIKLYLYEGYPVVLVVRMKADFRDDAVLSSPYVWTNDSSDDVNHHAVTAVGYDDQKQSLLLMNSWGTQWKDQGYCWASYDNFTTIDQNNWCAEAHVLKVKKSAPFDAWMADRDSDSPANPFVQRPSIVWRHFSLKNDRKVYEGNQIISPASWKVDGLACNNKNLFLLARDQTVYQMNDDLSGVSWTHLSRSPLDDEKVCMMAAAQSQALHVLTDNQTLYKYESASANWLNVPLPRNNMKPVDLRTINDKIRVITDKGTVYQQMPNSEWDELKRIQP
ncbi:MULTISPECIES: C1 family peptidase [Rhodopirellula]|uniref:C1 family peptidase n=1 Tax=Rhodopirellula TaxID=265488 RepID=UPI00257BEC49|nr:C1 family peptidase [Rhodopirellula sp. UBA1907]